jgi:transcriptional regulator with XRE-family HTH domain
LGATHRDFKPYLGGALAQRRRILTRQARRRLELARQAVQASPGHAPTAKSFGQIVNTTPAAPVLRCFPEPRRDFRFAIVTKTLQKKLSQRGLGMSRNPNATDGHVGRRIRMRRLLLHMSQEKLAGKLGVTFQQVQKYEKGTNRVSASRLQEVSQVLQVPVQFFFDGLPEVKGTGKGHEASDAFASDFLASSDGITVAKAFSKIKNRSLRRLIVQLIKEIASSDAAVK